LQTDPDEQHNLILLPKYKIEIDRMKKRLQEVKREYKDTEASGELK
jgi:type III secretory pathway component EscU